MSRRFLGRLGLDFAAAGLLLVGLAYHWLDNLSHELVGTAMFAFLALHAAFNRRWYAALVGRRPVGLAWVSTVLNLTLLVTMLALVGSSLAISRDVFGALGLEGGFTARRIHALAAYWALVIVSLHLGLHWPMIMGAARRLLRLRAPSPVRTILLRAATAVLAVLGIAGSFDLGIGSKLASELSMDWWDFDAAALGFFQRVVAIVALYAALAHYALRVVSWRRARSDDAQSPPTPGGSKSRPFATDVRKV